MSVLEDTEITLLAEYAKWKLMRNLELKIWYEMLEEDLRRVARGEPGLIPRQVLEMEIEKGKRLLLTVV
jgi:hypothetical protein